MRLFIGIDFNNLKDYFIEFQSLFPKTAKLSFTKTFHITLKFLGDVQPDKVDDITHILKNIKSGKLDVSLDSIGIFPTENYIRVVWVGVKPEDGILELQKSIDGALSKLFKKEKDFNAHITLARVKHPEDKKAFLEQLKKIKIESRKVEIKEFKLIKSIFTPRGHVYEELEVFDI